MRIWLGLILLGLLGWTAGCAHKRDGFNTQGFSQLPSSPGTHPSLPSTPQTIIVTPETALTGKIVKVNMSGRFVVLNFPIGHLPAQDQLFNIYHLGLKAGEVKVSGPQLEDNIVGDLTNGSAQVGDEAREQ